jgi:alkyl hydroperoxide reductase subunit AhpF
MTTEKRTRERDFLLPLAAAYGSSVLSLFRSGGRKVDLAPSLLEQVQNITEELSDHETITE